MLFKLVTPERVLFEEEVLSATLPTETGEITVLPNHVPLVTNLVPGVAELKLKDGNIEDVALSSGCIKIGENTITVLADTAERGEELDLSVIEEAKAKADKLMKEKVSESEESFAEAAAIMERELARYKAVNKYRQRKGLRTSNVREELKTPSNDD
jgi:F-type H+-transporting ATPase subunit epsilon